MGIACLDHRGRDDSLEVAASRNGCCRVLAAMFSTVATLT